MHLVSNIRGCRVLPIPRLFVNINRRRFSMAQQQPAWSLPEKDIKEPVLKVLNSLTKSKTEFIPKNGKSVKWYNCGPTVYDDSHMGHARNYVTQDILRRIMTDYFGYDVHFVMNITDIEDKIIERARQTHLLKMHRNSITSLTPELIAQVQESWVLFARAKLSKCLPEANIPKHGDELNSWPSLIDVYESHPEFKAACLQKEEKADLYLTTLKRAWVALNTADRHTRAGQTGLEQATELLDATSGILAVSLDQKLKHTVTDPSIPRALASHFETRFFSDMSRLHVRPPDTLTRVTEYVPEIVSYVNKIVENGTAYAAEGNVYFDTKKFDEMEGFSYARLEPWSRNNQALLEGGEGVLSDSRGQRSPADFVLWKSSKPGEPSWPSPWGPGRPGWHIECSVMASAIFGDNMDIHSGGSDLAFPHHDNELAQSEAYHQCTPWVNYFLHTGHLHIEGLKMSKSLKNFITISEILDRYTPRQLRLAFLTVLWNTKVDFSEGAMSGEIRNIESSFNNFFAVVKALTRQNQDAIPDGQHRYGPTEVQLIASLAKAKEVFRAALCDSFNTPEALATIRDVVSKTNVYIGSAGKNVNTGVVTHVARWVGNMLRMFGLGEGPKGDDDIGWGELAEGDSAGGSDRETIIMPYLNALSTFRDGVRKLAIAKDDTALKNILALCDQLRDETMVPLGVALDDQEDGKALVKLVSPADLIRAREEKRAMMDSKASKKAATVAAERAKRVQKLEKGSIKAEEMFKPPHVAEGTYGSWNDEGLPLTDGEGKELSKSAGKRVAKEWAAQKKARAEYGAWVEAGRP